MKILITARLADRSLLEHIYPITLVKDIDEIMIVRDTKGIDLRKVKYYCPPSWALKIAPIAFISKFLILLYLSILKKPKLVHGYLLFPHASLAFLAGKLTGKNVGISLIAGPIELYAGGSPIGTYPYCDPLPILNKRAVFFKKILEKSNLVAVTGSYTINFLKSIGISEEKIIVPPKTIDEKFFCQNIKKEYDIIYVGRLHQLKHIETLLKAACVVKNTYPDIKVAIIGIGECREILEKLSNTLGLNDNVYFLGYQKNVWDWFNKAKISVICSEREGLARSAVESMRCGVPVITSNCGDINDLIKDGFNGSIVNKYDDYEEYAQKILELLENDELLKAYIANCPECLKPLTIENATFIWENAIQSLPK
jgi:glycosyltransferase involved in cell wall biosynthesis